jgi:hypothetical protein
MSTARREKPPTPAADVLIVLAGNRMRFLPPLVHQDVEGYEEVFEVHAEHRLPFGELSRRQWRASG